VRCERQERNPMLYLSSSNIPIDPHRLRDGRWMARTGDDQTLALMTLERPPTAAFRASDPMAMGALDAARTRAGHPALLSIVGYDDQEMVRYFVLNA
jgi:DNA-binding LacI/PurR family transcriptional regulator